MGSAPTQRKEFSQAQSLLKMHFAKTGMMGNLLGNSGQEMAQHNIELYNRVKEGENPYEVAKEMIEADKANTVNAAPASWDGTLAKSEIKLQASYKAAGKDPKGAHAVDYNYEYDELKKYAQDLETQQAIEAHSGK